MIEMTPNASAARATSGRTNPFVDFQASRPIPDEMSIIDAILVICFLHSLCKHWDSFLELRDFDLVSMMRFSFHDPAIVHVRDGIGVMKYTAIMCYDDYGPIRMDSILREQFHHALAGRVIERRGGFVA